MSDKRDVSMWDLIKALRAAGIHAENCVEWKGGFQRADKECDCWVNSDQDLSLAENG